MSYETCPYCEEFKDDCICAKPEEKMILTKEQMKEFETAAKPLIKWLNENCNPHAMAVVIPTGAEVLSSSGAIKCEEFLKD